MAKGNKKNYELFAENLEKLMENSEMREGYFRKGRVASFSKDDGKFISFWKLDKPGQLDEFLDNNNLI